MVEFSGPLKELGSIAMVLFDTFAAVAAGSDQDRRLFEISAMMRGYNDLGPLKTGKHLAHRSLRGVLERCEQRL